MSKGANIYWDDSRVGYPAVARKPAVARRTRSQATKTRRRTVPWWLSFLIVTSIFVMLCVSINFRAFTEMREEASQNTRLASQIQSLMDENLALQEEIHSLRTDPALIQREARKIGMDLRQEKVPVQTN